MTKVLLLFGKVSDYIEKSNVSVIFTTFWIAHYPLYLYRSIRNTPLVNQL